MQWNCKNSIPHCARRSFNRVTFSIFIPVIDFAPSLEMLTQFLMLKEAVLQKI